MHRLTCTVLLWHETRTACIMSSVSITCKSTRTLCAAEVVTKRLLMHALTSLPFACRQDTKELKLRPGTEVHDYDVRVRSAQKFIAKVKPPLAGKTCRPSHCSACMPNLPSNQPGWLERCNLLVLPLDVVSGPLVPMLCMSACHSPPSCPHAACCSAEGVGALAQPSCLAWHSAAHSRAGRGISMQTLMYRGSDLLQYSHRRALLGCIKPRPPDTAPASSLSAKPRATCRATRSKSLSSSRGGR